MVRSLLAPLMLRHSFDKQLGAIRFTSSKNWLPLLIKSSAYDNNNNVLLLKCKYISKLLMNKFIITASVLKHMV